MLCSFCPRTIWETSLGLYRITQNRGRTDCTEHASTKIRPSKRLALYICPDSFWKGGSCKNRFVLKPDVAIGSEVSIFSKNSLAMTDFPEKKSHLVNYCENPLPGSWNPPRFAIPNLNISFFSGKDFRGIATFLQDSDSRDASLPRWVNAMKGAFCRLLKGNASRPLKGETESVHPLHPAERRANLLRI